MPVSSLPANWAKVGELILGILTDFMGGFFLYALVFVFLMGAMVKHSKVFGGTTHAVGTTGRHSKTMEEKVGQLFGLAIAVLMARTFPLKVYASKGVLSLIAGTIFGVLAYAILEKYTNPVTGTHP